MTRAHILIALVVGLGCQGEIQVPTVDVGDVSTGADLTATPDMSGAPDEGGEDPDPLCVGVSCMMNAECGRGQCWCSAGFMGDPNAGCTPGNPCADADCTFGATCRDSGECLCDVGFMENLGNCEPVVDDFPLDRTVDEVCARWTTDYPESAGVQWQVQPPDQCSAGERQSAFLLDAVRRVSLYRWLVGLPAVTTTSEYALDAQACATALEAQNVGATNEIAPSFTCYSEAAAAGALNSSILLGAASPAAAVDTFVEDASASSLGNRRWIFNPGMGATAFGYRGDYTCMFATDPNGVSSPQYIAYPFGVFPQEALRGRWMWASSQLFADASTTVTVMDSAGDNVSVTNVETLPGNIFPAAVAWEVGSLPAGEYTVTLQGLSGAMNELTYPVNIVTCP